MAPSPTSRVELSPRADSSPTDKSQRRDFGIAPFIHPPESDQPAPSEPRQRRRSHSWSGLPIGMGRRWKERRKENQPTSCKQGFAKLAAVMHSRSGSPILYYQLQLALPCQDPETAHLRCRRLLEKKEAAPPRKALRRPDRRSTSDDQPLRGDGLAAGHGRSYSANR